MSLTCVDAVSRQRCLSDSCCEGLRPWHLQQLCLFICESGKWWYDPIIFYRSSSWFWCSSLFMWIQIFCYLTYMVWLASDEWKFTDHIIAQLFGVGKIMIFLNQKIRFFDLNQIFWFKSDFFQKIRIFAFFSLYSTVKHVSIIYIAKTVENLSSIVSCTLHRIKVPEPVTVKSVIKEVE